MRGSLALFAVALCVAIAHAEVVELTYENYDLKTIRKNVFIKFFAPWCHHCRAMAADWEKIAEHFADNDVLLVGEVNCEEEDELCSDHDITGFPTILYGDAEFLDEYHGQRDFEAMKEFVDDTLVEPLCSVDFMDSCSKEDKETIIAFQGKTIDELVEMVEEVELRTAEIEEHFEEQVQNIQKQYEAAAEEFNTKTDAVKDQFNYELARMVLSAKEREQNQEEEL